MTTSDKILDLIEQFRTEGKSFCIATILRTADSTSARPGAKAVIAMDGDLYGYVGGGCVTGAVRRGALEALKDNVPKMIRIKPKDDVVSLVDTDGVQLHKSSCLHRTNPQDNRCGHFCIRNLLDCFTSRDTLSQHFRVIECCKNHISGRINLLFADEFHLNAPLISLSS